MEIEYFTRDIKIKYYIRQKNLGPSREECFKKETGFLQVRISLRRIGIITRWYWKVSRCESLGRLRNWFQSCKRTYGLFNDIPHRWIHKFFHHFLAFYCNWLPWNLIINTWPFLKCMCQSKSCVQLKECPPKSWQQINRALLKICCLNLFIRLSSDFYTILEKVHTIIEHLKPTGRQTQNLLPMSIHGACISNEEYNHRNF